MKTILYLINGVCLLIISYGIILKEINIIPCSILILLNSIYFMYKFIKDMIGE